MSSQHDGRLLSLRRDVGDNSPHEPLGLRVYASTGLVKQNDRRVANQGDGALELALVAT